MQVKGAICLGAMAAVLAGTATQAQQNLAGRWLITSTIISTTMPNPQVKEGFTKQENWVIGQQGNRATLTSPSGSIAGAFATATPEFPQGVWHFKLFVPQFLGQANLAAEFEVVIPPGPNANIIQGGSSVTYYGIDYMSGGWAPLGKESWRFVGQRQ